MAAFANLRWKGGAAKVVQQARQGAKALGEEQRVYGAVAALEEGRCGEARRRSERAIRRESGSSHLGEAQREKNGPAYVPRRGGGTLRQASQGEKQGDDALKRQSGVSGCRIVVHAIAFRQGHDPTGFGGG